MVGACWFGEACDPNSQPNVHTPYADMDINNPANMKGIFEFENPQNPFADHSFVVVPYCNGDVHIGGGQRDYIYQNDAGENNVTVLHNGYKNSQTVLEWVYRNFPSPSRIVVSGSSAGAIAGSFYAGLVSEHYPRTPVVLIADAAGGYASPLTYRTFEAWNVASVLPDWPEYNDETNKSLSFQDFYNSANHNQNLTIAQFNTAEDLVQYNFSLLIGDKQGSFLYLSAFLPTIWKSKNTQKSFSITLLAEGPIQSWAVQSSINILLRVFGSSIGYQI